MVWTFDESPFYVHPGNISRLGLEYSLPIVFFCVVTMLCLLTVRRQPLLTAVWSTYLVTLLPVLGITAVGPTAMAARFTYVPGLPLALLLAAGVVALYDRCAGLRPVRIGIVALVVIACAVYGYGTVTQISYWRDDVTLWTRAIDLHPYQAGRPYFQRSYALARRGEFGRALADVNTALAIAERKKYHRMHDIYEMRAGIYRDMQAFDLAVADLSRALETARGYDRLQLYMQRGAIYRTMGEHLLAEKDFRDATKYAGGE